MANGKNGQMVAVTAQNIPSFEQEMIRQAITATLRKAETHRYMGVKVARTSIVVAVLRAYASKNGSGFSAGARGWEAQISRWMAAGCFPEFAVTPFGIMSVKDLAALEKNNERAKYAGRKLTYLQKDTSETQQNKNVQNKVTQLAQSKVTTPPAKQSRPMRQARQSRPSLNMAA